MKHTGITILVQLGKTHTEPELHINYNLQAISERAYNLEIIILEIPY